MSEIKEWLTTIKQEKPELNDFIILLENYFSETGFNALEFEKAVDAELNSMDEQVRKFLKDGKNAKD